MEILSNLFGTPLKAAAIIGGLIMLALGALLYWRWQSQKGQPALLAVSGGASPGTPSILTVGAVLLALGVASILCGVISPLGVAAPQIALTTRTGTPTFTPTPTHTPVTRTLTATNVPPPATDTPKPPTHTLTRTATRTSTRRPTSALTRTPTATASPTPPPTVRPLPNVFILDTTFKATKCGSPGARATYTVNIEGSAIKMDHSNGRNKYEGTITAAREFKMNGVTNIGGGVSEVFEGKFGHGESFFDVFFELTTYTIKGQPCEEVWQVEGTGRQP